MSGKTRILHLWSWNVNGFRAILGKDFDSIFAGAAADIFCLQETKVSEGQVDKEFEGYLSAWHYADKKGYSGTAVYTRLKPEGVQRGIGIDEHDHEGRVLTLDFGTFYLVTAYAPNSQSGLARLPYRRRWEEAFCNFVKGLDAQKPVIICGDLNVAHNDIDLKNPRTNHNSAGFSDQERQDFGRLLDAGFADTFRRLHPDSQCYSWWSYRYRAREKNIGWRIDYFLVSERIMHRVRSAEIKTDIHGSDHCPVYLAIEI